ncbi:hypothetical protein EII31_00310 [Leucobacter sp. OH2974_COT-288]|nr:hypothetical protein EII31_00310 [Leucobacter sp. OH2974_COT-288]
MTKRNAVLVLLAAALGGLLIANQPWLTLQYTDGAVTETLQLTGTQLNAALMPVLIAILIGALVLPLVQGISSKILAVILGVQAIFLAAVAWQTWRAGVSPAASFLAEKTGITGGAQLDLITAHTQSPMGGVTIGCAAVALLGAVMALFVKSTHTTGTSRYDRVTQPRAESSRTTAATAVAATGGSAVAVAVGDDPVAEADRISDWDALTKDQDPTV